MYFLLKNAITEVNGSFNLMVNSFNAIENEDDNEFAEM